MIPSDDPRERLVAHLLRATDRGWSTENLANPEPLPIDSHPSAEDLALAAWEGLNPPQNSPLVRHLATCAACREIFVLLLAPQPTSASAVASAANGPVTDSPSIPAPPARATRRSWIGVLLSSAALVATAIGLVQRPIGSPPPGVREALVFSEARQQLEAGHFPQAEQLVANAAARGIVSARLDQLAARAVLGTAGELLVGQPGRLTELGFDLGGVRPRSTLPEAERERARRALTWLKDSPQGESLLWRGELLLMLGEATTALEVFREARQDESLAARAWNGMGRALYLQEQYAAASAAFREAIPLDPQSPIPVLNLALALEELEDAPAARAAWTALRDLPGATESDRRRARAALRQLPDQTVP